MAGVLPRSSLLLLYPARLLLLIRLNRPGLLLRLQPPLFLLGLLQRLLSPLALAHHQLDQLRRRLVAHSPAVRADLLLEQPRDTRRVEAVIVLGHDRLQK